MNVLVLLIPVSLILGGLGLLAFWLMLRAGQFTDPDGDSGRALQRDWDDRPKPPR